VVVVVVVMGFDKTPFYLSWTMVFYDLAVNGLKFLQILAFFAKTNFSFV
jgi:hypothetical protein